MTALLEKEEVFCGSLEIKKINNLLNDTKTRSLGLELLLSFLPQCSHEDFNEWCVSWMQSCCKEGFRKNNEYSTTLLSELFKVAANYPELKKPVSFFITTRYFNYFFKYCLNSQAGWHCTEICLSLFRGACGPFQETISEHLNMQLNENAECIPAALRCYALLPCLGRGGKNNEVNCKESWRSQFLKCINVCHSIFNEFFVDIKELQEYNTLELSLPFAVKGNIMNCLTGSLKVYCNILCFMLMNKYPTAKSIPIDNTFQMICRGLAVNPTTLGKNQTTQIIALKKILPAIHSSLYSVLNAVIVTCGNQLLPYSHLICKLLKQTLEWTNHTFDFENQKLVDILKISVYETICDWTVATRSGSCCEEISKVIISSGVKDIHSEKTQTILKDTKQGNKKKCKEQVTFQIDTSNSVSRCYAALKALEFLIKYSGTLLKIEEHKFLQENVLKLLVTIQNNKTSDVSDFYSTSACRKKLYQLLWELVNRTCQGLPPPTHCALRIFSRGQNDNSFEVSQFCSTALNSLTNIIHSQFNNAGFFTCETSNNSKGLDDSQFPQTKISVDVNKDINNDKGIGEVLMISERSLEKNANSSLSEDKNISDLSEKTSNQIFESDVSSLEDSIITVSYAKEDIDKERECEENFKEKEADHLTQDFSEGSSFVDEPLCKKQKTVEKVTPDKLEVENYTINLKSPSEKVKSLDEKIQDSLSVSSNETVESSKECSAGLKKKCKLSEELLSENSENDKSISEESLNDENKTKDSSKGYFLRSKSTKALSEDAEDLKEASKIEKVRTPTPSKMFTKNPLNGTKERPKTRAFLKLEKTENQPDVFSVKKNNFDEDEDIIESFNDSFVD